MKNYREVVIGPYSAYQIAVKHGFEGTEEEWIRSVERDRLAAEAAAEKAKEYINADATLTISGAPADAAVTGEKLNDRYTKAEVDDKIADIVSDKTLRVDGGFADAKVVGDIILPRLSINIESESSLIITDGRVNISCTSKDKIYHTILPHDGEWTVTGTLGTGITTETVQAEYCRTKTLTLTYYTMTVTVNAGSVVTAQCGDKTVTGIVPESGSIKLYLPIAGTWSVTATLDGQTATDSVEVSEYRDYPLELAYVHIYGASWDGTSTTKWSRTDEAAEFTDPVPYVAGASSYGSPFDNLQLFACMTKS